MNDPYRLRYFARQFFTWRSFDLVGHLYPLVRGFALYLYCIHKAGRKVRRGSR